MPVVVACSKCQSKYQVPEKALGKSIVCQKCGHKFVATAPLQTRSAAAVAAAGPSARVAATAPATISGASADELARFGLDGPLRRQPDPLADSYTPPPKDILGNFAADPGFSAPQSNEVVKKKGIETSEGVEAIIANPYAGQARTTGVVADSSTLPGVGFTSLKTIASLALGIGIIAAVSYAVATGIVLYLTYLLWNFTPGSAPPFDPADLVTIGRVDFAAKITFLICIPAYLIAFSMFTFQGYENLKAIGTKELTFGSPLAAFSWMIPLANWVLPALIMSELSRASKKPVGDQWRSKPASIKLWIWWGLNCLFWIGFSALSAYLGSGVIRRSSDSIEELSQTSMILAIWCSLTLILLIVSVALAGSLKFAIVSSLDKAWPGAKKSKKGTGKVAPSAIPYIYSGIILVVGALALIGGAIGIFLVAGEMQESSTLQMVWQYGVPSVLGILAIVSGPVGVIHLVKAFR